MRVLVDDEDAAELAVGRAVRDLVDVRARLVADRGGVARGDPGGAVGPVGRLAGVRRRPERRGAGLVDVGARCSTGCQWRCCRRCWPPPTPTLETAAVWLMTWIVPRLPETVTVWVSVVPDWLPTAVASPEWAAPVPAESVPALPPSWAWAAVAPSRVTSAPPERESARLRTKRPLVARSRSSRVVVVKGGPPGCPRALPGGPSARVRPIGRP